jgi:hypothetical protein
MRKLIAMTLTIAMPAPALAWNDMCHMVIARLAWNKLTGDQRSKVLTLLKKHPHYEEFLTAKRPDGFEEDEWVFLRVATWSDWVRTHHAKEYHHGPWHYINYPFVPEGSSVDAGAHPPEDVNIVKVLPVCLKKIKNGDSAEKAVYLCWLFHLVEPLHCTAMFSEAFPNGDQGGNLALIRFRTSPVKLHSFWDGLLGKSTSAGPIRANVKNIETMLKDDPSLIQADLEGNTTFESWARESFALAKKQAYLNGKLKVASSKNDIDEDKVPQAPASYAKNAGRIARIQVGKAGQRLAEQIRKVIE